MRTTIPASKHHRLFVFTDATDHRRAVLFTVIARTRKQVVRAFLDMCDDDAELRRMNARLITQGDIAIDNEPVPMLVQ